MYSVSTNATMLFLTLFTLVEKEVISRFEVEVGKYNIEVPAFKVIKNYKTYIVEPNLKQYGVYDYDDYYGGVGLALFEGDTFALSDYFKGLA